MSQEEWVAAADGGDVATVRKLIATVTESDRSSAMYRAIARDDLAIVQEIVAAGEAVDEYLLGSALGDKAEKVARWILGQRPGDAAREGVFASACATVSIELLELLVENGASIDDRESGWSGLGNAARAKRGDIVDWLVKKKAAVRGWLLGAVAAGDLEMAKRALKAGDDLAVVDEQGTSALMLAAAGNHRALVAWLVEQLDVPAKAKPAAKSTSKAKPKKSKTASASPLDLADREGRTAIAHAAREGHLDIVRLLADAGADLDAAMAFVANNYDRPAALLEIATFLLDRGANIDARHEGNRDTALIEAAEHGWTDVVDLLIERGADIHLGNIIDTTALGAAANRGHVEVVKRLLAAGARLSVDSRSYSDSPLERAIERESVELVRLFLDRGAMNAKSRKPPLITAAEKGNREIVELLLDRGADVNWVDDSYDQDTALRKAARGGHREVVELLLDRGATEPGPREGYEVDDYTAIRRAGAGGHIEVVELLADRGFGDPTTSGIVMGVAQNSNNAERMTRALEIAPDANAPGEYGWMPLHRASDRGHLDNVRVLLDHGADPNLADKDGNVPHRIATNNKHRDVAALLEARGATLQLVELIALAGRGTDAEVLAMLERPVNVNVANDDRRRALHEAAEYGRLAIVHALLDKGADIDAADNDGWTALMEAADMGHLAIVELLLDRGAAPFLADRTGFTAFALAEEARRGDVVALMRKRSADVDPAVALQRAIEDEDTETIARLAPVHGFTKPLPSYKEPLEFAASAGKPASIAALVAAGAEVDRVLNEYGYTPLYRAAESGTLAAVQALIAAGAKPRANGTLQRAVWREDIEIVTALLDAGFDPNELHGESLIVESALSSRNAALVRLLLDRGTKVTGKPGASLVARAVDYAEDLPGLVEELLAKGAPVDGTSYSIRERIETWVGEGRTITLLDPQAALASAATGSDDQFATLDLALAQGANPSLAESADAEPPILRAAGYSYWTIVDRLLAAGADPNARSYRTVAQITAREQQFALLDKLVAAGAKLDGCIAAMIERDALPKKAAERKRIAALCLANGDNLDARSDDGKTALCRALETPDKDVAKLLVELGASVNAASEDGKTPLMVAALVEDSDDALSLVTWLVDNGADIHATTEKKATAIHFAARRGHEDIVDFFLARKAAVAGCLAESASSGKMALVEKFLDVCELEEKDSTGSTPVQNAAAAKSKKVFELFLDRGASVAECAINAAWTGNKAHIVLALKRGAHVDAKDSAGRTALMCAVDNPACVELLIEEGANLDLQDEDGSTALIHAARFREKKAIELLLAAGANRGLRDNEGKTAADHTRYDHDLLELLEV